MLELPAYHWPNLRNLAIGLWQRVEIFLTRVGTIILALMVILWALELLSRRRRRAPRGPAIQYSIAGHLGAGLAVLFAPIGFNWQISIALVPGLAAREVAVGALGTVYALSATGEDVSRRADAADRAFLEPADRAVAARLVRVRAAVPVDARHGEARDQFLALSAHHGGLSVRHWPTRPRGLTYRIALAFCMSGLVGDLLVALARACERAVCRGESRTEAVAGTGLRLAGGGARPAAGVGVESADCRGGSAPG